MMPTEKRMKGVCYTCRAWIGKIITLSPIIVFDAHFERHSRFWHSSDSTKSLLKIIEKEIEGGFVKND